MEFYKVCQYYSKIIIPHLFVLNLANVIFFAGCGSNSILNSQLSVTPEEQKRLMGAVDRKSNHRLYESNLANIAHPKENDLLKEADLVDSENFSANYEILVDWYTNNLSKRARSQLVNNCVTLVGNFSEQFPLTENSLPCIGWWLEQKSSVRKIGAKQATNRQTKSKPFLLPAKERSKWIKYKNMEFVDALHNVNGLDFTQASTLEKSAQATLKNCQYKNANAALIFKLEEFLSKDQVYQKIEKIYQNSSQCYAPNDKITERLHLRMGVLRLIHGNYQLAGKALKKNQLESAPKDESRSLFWLGVIEHQKKQNDKNPYWEQMIRDNPFGFFSILANDKMNRDPTDVFVPDSTINMQNRISGGWNENNLQAFLFDLFYARQEERALNYFSHLVSGNVSIIHKNLYLYWAVSHSLAENDRASIVMLAKYFDQQKQRRVSLGLLKLNFPTRYSEEILNTSEKIDPLLVLALIRQESAFDTKAQSSANARGLMQLLPSTARVLERGVTPNKLYEPKTNIKLGIKYLEKLYERYDGRTECVLAAYNAGPNRVDAWTERVANATPLLFMEYMPFRETRNYVSTIMRNYYWYKRLMSDEKHDQFAKLYLERNLTSVWKPTNVVSMFDLLRLEN